MLKQIIGQFLRPDGSPAANATLYLLVSQDAIDTSPMSTVVHARIPVVLDASGNIPTNPPTMIEPNDTLLPLGTYYHCVLVDGAFGKIFDERLVIQGASPINFNSLVPALLPS